MIESTVQIRFYLLHTLFLVLDDVAHPDAASYKSQSDDALDKLKQRNDHKYVECRKACIPA